MQGIAVNAKGLTENIRSIVKGIEAADSNKLKVHFQFRAPSIIRFIQDSFDSAGNSMESLTEATKVVAKFVAKEGTETQLVLLKAAKSVGESLFSLINMTRINSQNHQFNPTVIDQLKQASTGTVFSITKLVKTVTIVRDDQLKGPTALKKTIDALQNKSEELSFDKVTVQSGVPEPEELIMATRPLTFAAGKAVQVGKSCNTVEVIELCSQSKDAAVNLIETVVSIASVTENEQLRKKVLHQTDQIIQDFAQLLSSLHDRLIKGI